MRGAALLVLIGCGREEEAGGEQYLAYPLAGDVVIDKVLWYQGVEKALYLGPQNFGTGTRPPPILTGRDALLRVAVSAYDEYAPRDRPVAIVLELSSGDLQAVVAQVVPSTGFEHPDLDSGAAFPIPGQFVGEDLVLTVSIHEAENRATGGYVDETVWSSEADGLDVVVAEREKLVIVPVKYMADGSGRLPDTGPERIAEIASRYTAMFPVDGLDVEVKEPLAWVPEIGPFTGWDTLLFEISDLREAADEPPATFYYGLFDPAPSLAQYCGYGCILGLSNLAVDPGSEWQRASVGLGFDDVVISTLVHEVGHAHGRDHAPCGLLGQPSDPQYPYANAGLGAWGYDIVEDELVDPNAAADMMSYCEPQWVSDYTFGALLDRIGALTGSARGQVVTWHRLLVAPDGTAVPRGTVQGGVAPGRERRVEWLDGARVVADGEGWFVPYDHLDGGVLLVSELEGRTARLLP